MQEKNAIEINSLHDLMRNRLAFKKTSVPISIAWVQNNNAFSISFKARRIKYSRVILLNLFGYQADIIIARAAVVNIVSI